MNVAVDWAEHGVPNSMLIQKPFPVARLVAAYRDGSALKCLRRLSNGYPSHRTTERR